MGVLNQKGRITAPKPTIRIERVPIEKPKPKPKPANSYNSSSASLLQHRYKPQGKPASQYSGSSSTDESRRNKRKASGAASSRSPSVVKFDSDDDDDAADDGSDDLFRRKKRRLLRNDPDRKLRHPKIWTGATDDKESQRALGLIHAAELANLKQNCKPDLRLSEEDVGIELRYPGARQRERYVLLLSMVLVE